MDIKVTKRYVVFALIVLILISIIFHMFVLPSLNKAKNTGQMSELAKIAAAVEKYKRIVRNSPEDYDAHVQLGRLYLEVGELDSAKVEFYQAIKLAPKNNYDAHFALANFYIDQNELFLAEDLVNTFDTVRIRRVNKQRGEFYMKLAEKTLLKDPNKAAREFKAAYKCLRASEAIQKKEVKEDLTQVGFQVTDRFIKVGQVDEAIKLLKYMLNFNRESEVYFRIGQLYEVKNLMENAFEYYKTAYTLENTDETKEAYYNSLLKTAQNYELRQDVVKAKYYYYLARKLKWETKIPTYSDTKLLISIIYTKFMANEQGDKLFPVIGFKLRNIDKYDIKYIKTRVVFEYKNKVLYQDDKIIADENNPLPAGESSANIKVFSKNPIEKLSSDKKVGMRIYISDSNPDNWVLYRIATTQEKNKN